MRTHSGVTKSPAGPQALESSRRQKETTAGLFFTHRSIPEILSPWEQPCALQGQCDPVQDLHGRAGQLDQDLAGQTFSVVVCC